MARYDLNRFHICSRFKHADKLYISVLESLSEEVGVYGQFGGEVSLFDSRSDGATASWKVGREGCSHTWTW